MRIAFLGAIEFSRHCLERILEQGGDVVGVFAPWPECARRNADYVDLAAVAERHGVPAHRFCKIAEPEAVARLRELAPDVVFVLGLSQLVPKEVLEIPRLGCIGSHPALLPRNRGRHPLIWALAEGLEESGLTFFWLDEGADSGDILWQRPFRITLADDAASLYRKIEERATEAIAEFLPQLEAGTAPRVPQDHAQASYWRKRTEEDGEIRWDTTSLDTYNLVRALTRPYPGAHTWAGERRLRVWRAVLEPAATVAEDAAPGTVLESGENWLLVRTGDGVLRLTEYESGDDAPLDLAAGERLGRPAAAPVAG